MVWRASLSPRVEEAEASRAHVWDQMRPCLKKSVNEVNLFCFIVWTRWCTKWNLIATLPSSFYYFQVCSLTESIILFHEPNFSHFVSWGLQSVFYMCLLFLRLIIDMTSVCSWKSLLEKAMDFELYMVIYFYIFKLYWDCWIQYKM